MNGSHAAMCVTSNKSIQVHSRGNSERMDREFYSFLIMKNLSDKAFLISVLLKKGRNLVV